MDNIYSKKNYESSDNISLSDFTKEAAEIVKEFTSNASFKHMSEKRKVETVLEKLEISDETLRATIVKNTSINLLTCPGADMLPKDLDLAYQNTKIFPEREFDIPETAKSLQIVKTQLDYLKKNKESLRRASGRGTIEIIPDTTSDEKDLQPGTEIVISVRVYQPFPLQHGPTLNYVDKLTFNQEFILLGRNTLTELRDMITCTADVKIPNDVDYPTPDIPLTNAKIDCPSGFLFIDDVFYNDFRDPKSIDYSEVLRKWAIDIKIGNLQSKSMEATRIRDLKPRFGYPYVYQHQKVCEHIFVFSDCWLISESDNLNSKNYPAIGSFATSVGKICCICYAEHAKWVCEDSDRLPHFKNYLCKECLVSYQYKDGKKIGNFKVYPFVESDYSGGSNE